MSRRHSAERREINPDPKYGNLVVSKFMNSIMRAGKKSVAERPAAIHSHPAGAGKSETDSFPQIVHRRSEKRAVPMGRP